MIGKTVMIQGTSSDVGKSIIVQALCRNYANQGLKLFPFKSQNMSYSFVTNTGGEMSYSQAQQALAAKRIPDIRMNPILLQPVHNEGSKVIVKGEDRGFMSAKEYHLFKPHLKDYLNKLIDEIKHENDLIIIEGAGSPVEINLNEHDIVNMGLANISDSPVILVADIERGGVFASIYGTLALISEEYRKRVKGLIINKFLWDSELLEPGLKLIEDLTGIPVIGVIPVFDLPIVDEDSLGLRKMSHLIDPKKDLDIAIISFKRIKNLPDYQSLFQQNDVHLRLVSSTEELGSPDLIIFPDHQSITENAIWLESTGLNEALKHVDTHMIAFSHGALHLAITWQTNDHKGVGIGLIEHNLTLKTIKSERHKTGYRDTKLNIESLEKTIGWTATLGLFADEKWTRDYLNHIRINKGLEPYTGSERINMKDTYDQLANLISMHIDMSKLENIIN